MSSTRLAKLIADLKLATKVRGKKIVLARTLKVPQARVSQWLSGASAPNAEDALALIEWVESEANDAQQKKRAGSAETQPAQKTRKRKSRTNEKPKSNPAAK